MCSNKLATAILKSFTCFNPDKKFDRSDRCFLYATETLTLELIWLAFNDSIGEGDGDRVWKISLVFKVQGH